jgi:hypothetical protein
MQRATFELFRKAGAQDCGFSFVGLQYRIAATFQITYD